MLDSACFHCDKRLPISRLILTTYVIKMHFQLCALTKTTEKQRCGYNHWVSQRHSSRSHLQSLDLVPIMTIYLGNVLAYGWLTGEIYCVIMDDIAMARE